MAVLGALMFTMLLGFATILTPGRCVGTDLVVPSVQDLDADACANIFCPKTDGPVTPDSKRKIIIF